MSNKPKANDRHRSPLTGIRFPQDLKKELKTIANEYKLSMNDIVVEGTRLILKEIKKKEKIL